MQITLNGRECEVADGCTLAGLLEQQGLAQRRVAVEVNRAIVPRSLHAQRELRSGDRIEIVQAIGGG